MDASINRSLKGSHCGQLYQGCSKLLSIRDCVLSLLVVQLEHESDRDQMQVGTEMSIRSGYSLECPGLYVATQTDV